MTRFLGHAAIVVALTALSQLGGLAWVASLLFRRRLFAFVTLYCAVSLGAVWLAPILNNREALPCFGESLRSQSLLYCALNRHYVTPDMARVAHDLAKTMDRQFPNTQTRTLDGNFPFFNGFPLLPHLSHDDGDKLDLAFYWRRDDIYVPGQSPSPMGYWGYAQGPTECPTRWDDLRWDMTWLQEILPKMQPDLPRLRLALSVLTDDPRVGKILIEPHLVTAMDLVHPKIRFQGCRAARHDDHIHLQLR